MPNPTLLVLLKHQWNLCLSWLVVVSLRRCVIVHVSNLKASSMIRHCSCGPVVVVDSQWWQEAKNNRIISEKNNIYKKNTIRCLLSMSSHIVSSLQWWQDSEPKTMTQYFLVKKNKKRYKKHTIHYFSLSLSSHVIALSSQTCSGGRKLKTTTEELVSKKRYCMLYIKNIPYVVCCCCHPTSLHRHRSGGRKLKTTT